MTDENKQGPDPDPWAALDADVEGQAADGDASFIFDMLGDDSGDPPSPATEPVPADGESGVENGAADGGIEGIPLAVFPPPEADPGQADEEPAPQPDADAALNDAPAEIGLPEIFSMAPSESDVAGEVERPESQPSRAGGDAAAEDTAGDLAALGLGFDDPATEMAAGTDADLSEFGDPAVDPPADENSFHAGGFPTAETSPFSDTLFADPYGSSPESSAEEMASIPIAAATAAITAPRKKKSVVGQVAGVVLGGLMALPVTYAILLWGFQKDPFKLARQVPDQVAFLVPQSLRQAGKAARPPQPAAVTRNDGPSLDDLPAPAAEPTPDAAPAEMATDGTKPAAASTTSADGEEETTEGKVAAMKKTDEVAEAAAAEKFFALPPDVPAELAEEFRAALAKLGTAEDIQAALERLNAEEMPAPVAMVVEPPVVPPPPAPPEPPQLDLTRLDTAVAQAAESLDALEAATDLDAMERKRLMVAWYRRLATLGEQFSLVETAAVATGRPLDRVPEVADGMLERIRVSEPAIEDLRTLGRMWLVARKRRADGTVLVATVESTRQLGPYWSTRVNLAAPDDAGRWVTVISRLQPAADIGEQILITGVLFDADTVWAADTRPLTDRPGVDADVPTIGIPSVFDEPQIPAPMLERPAKKPAEDAPPSRSASESEPVPAKAPRDGEEAASPQATGAKSADPKPTDPTPAGAPGDEPAPPKPDASESETADPKPAKADS